MTAMAMVVVEFRGRTQHVNYAGKYHVNAICAARSALRATRGRKTSSSKLVRINLTICVTTCMCEYLTRLRHIAVHPVAAVPSRLTGTRDRFRGVRSYYSVFSSLDGPVRDKQITSSCSRALNCAWGLFARLSDLIREFFERSTC